MKIRCLTNGTQMAMNQKIIATVWRSLKVPLWTIGMFMAVSSPSTFILNATTANNPTATGTQQTQLTIRAGAITAPVLFGLQRIVSPLGSCCSPSGRCLRGCSTVSSSAAVTVHGRKFVHTPSALDELDELNELDELDAVFSCRGIVQCSPNCSLCEANHHFACELSLLTQGCPVWAICAMPANPS